MALGESVIAVIDTAPESTVRAVLRALCAEDELMVRIANMLSKLPLDVESEEGEDQTAEQSDSGDTYPDDLAQEYWSLYSGGESSRHGKRKAAQMEICVQCEESFEEGDESLTCRYHPDDMEIDFESDFWADCGDEYDDTPFWREQNPDGFTFPCCGETGSSINEGCTMGKHRAADGKRGRYE